MRSINNKWVIDCEKRAKLDLMLLNKRKNQKKTQYLITQATMKAMDNKLRITYELPEIE